MIPNLTTGSVDSVVKAETSSHPKRPANNGVKGEVGSINFRGGRSTTFVFKFVAAFIMAVWANLAFGLWPGIGMNAYFAHTIMGFKGQSNPVKKVMFAVVIEGVIFIVMSLLAIRLMIFKIFSAWTMKAPMTGIGMFLAFIGLQSDNGIDIIRDHPAELVDLSHNVLNQLRSDNQNNKELDEQSVELPQLQQQRRELEKPLENLTKLHRQLRRKSAQQVQELQWKLRKQNNIATNFDNELATNFANKIQLSGSASGQQLPSYSFYIHILELKIDNPNLKNNELEMHNQKLEKKNLENKIFKKKLVPLLPDRHFALAASFQLFGYKAWKEFREASLEILFSKTTRDKELRHQLRRAQLDYKAFWSGSFKALCLSSFDDNSFADSSFTEETFKEGSFDDSSLQEETFSNNSLGEETFYDNSLEDSSFQDSSFEESSFAENRTASKRAALQRTASKRAALQRTENSFEQLRESSFAENSFEESSFAENREQLCFEESSLEENSFEKRRFSESSFEENRFQDSSFQRRTSTPELSQLPRRALPTELAQLQRNGLTKAASSFELTTAQLCAKEASFSILSGASFFTSRRRGGVLNSKACLPQLVPYQLDSWANLAQASPP